MEMSFGYHLTTHLAPNLESNEGGNAQAHPMQSRVVSSFTVPALQHSVSDQTSADLLNLSMLAVDPSFGGIQEAEDSAQFPRNGPTGNMIVSSKKRRGRPKGSTKAAGRNSNNNDSGDVLTPPFDGICDSTSESIDSRDESGKKTGSRGRPKGSTKANGFKVSSGRPVGTTRQNGYKVSTGRPVGTTRTNGCKVSPGRPKKSSAVLEPPSEIVHSPQSNLPEVLADKMIELSPSMSTNPVFMQFLGEFS